MTERSRSRRPSVGRSGRVIAGVSGAMTVALVLLAALVLVVKLLAPSQQWLGAGWGTVAAHLFGAVVAVVLQRYADRHPGRIRWGCARGVLLIGVVLFALYWWY